ncbi:MAG: S-layer homology domain-containing protein [Clostridia bacterium]|nr:S-layer homology domain-containing protein [Clostridia bacterium]
MFLKKATALFSCALILLGMMFCLPVSAAAPSPVTVSNELCTITIAQETVQIPGTNVTVSVWKPGCSASDLLQGKTLDEICIFIGETTVVTESAKNWAKMTIPIATDSHSGVYTVSVYVEGDGDPKSYPAEFQNLTNAGNVLDIVQNMNSTWQDIKAALDAKIIDVDIEAANGSTTGGLTVVGYLDMVDADNSRRNYIAQNIKTLAGNGTFSDPDDNVAMAALVSALRNENYKIAMTKKASGLESRALKELLENNAALFLIDDSMRTYNSLSDGSGGTVDRVSIVYNTLRTSIGSCVFPEDVERAFDAALLKAQEDVESSGTSARPSPSVSDRTPSVKVDDEDSEIITNNNPALPAPIAAFADIENVAWAKQAITVLAEAGAINGKTETEFYPLDNVKREEFAKMILGAFRIKTAAENALSFTDTRYGDWHYPYIHSAYQFGITGGISKTQFGVGMNITRQDMAVMVLNALIGKGELVENPQVELNFTDSDKIASYAKTAVGMLAERGIINGRDDGSFDPTATATRAEAAKMLYEAIYRFNLLYE